MAEKNLRITETCGKRLSPARWRAVPTGFELVRAGEVLARVFRQTADPENPVVARANEICMRAFGPDHVEFPNGEKFWFFEALGQDFSRAYWPFENADAATHEARFVVREGLKYHFRINGNLERGPAHIRLN